MHFSDFTARTLTGALAMGFFAGGLFGILDYFIVKFLLFSVFAVVAINIAINLFKNKPFQNT